MASRMMFSATRLPRSELCAARYIQFGYTEEQQRDEQKKCVCHKVPNWARRRAGSLAIRRGSPGQGLLDGGDCGGLLRAGCARYGCTHRLRTSSSGVDMEERMAR